MSGDEPEVLLRGRVTGGTPESRLRLAAEEICEAMNADLAARSGARDVRDTDALDGRTWYVPTYMVENGCEHGKPCMCAHYRGEPIAMIRHGEVVDVEAREVTPSRELPPAR